MTFHNTDDAFIRFVAIIICTGWTLLILLTSILVLGNIFYEDLTFIDKYILEIIYFVAIYCLLSFLLSTRPKCKICGEKVFQETLQIQKKVNYWAFVNGWAAVVLQIVTRNEFVCMHCGKTVSLKKPTNQPKGLE